MALDIYKESEEELKKKYTTIKSIDNEIEYKKLAIEIEEHILKEMEYEKQIELDKYRVQCVNRVLDFVRGKIRQGNLEINEIDNYLCHCQNMLNGNIDGIVLHLENKKWED